MPQPIWGTQAHGKRDEKRRWVIVSDYTPYPLSNIPYPLSISCGRFRGAAATTQQPGNEIKNPEGLSAAQQEFSR
jgi:hypothetical protein